MTAKRLLHISFLVLQLLTALECSEGRADESAARKAGTIEPAPSQAKARAMITGAQSHHSARPRRSVHAAPKGVSDMKSILLTAPRF